MDEASTATLSTTPLDGEQRLWGLVSLAMSRHGREFSLFARPSEQHAKAQELLAEHRRWYPSCDCAAALEARYADPLTAAAP